MAAMARQGGRVFSALFLVVTTAGLNICYASLTSAPAPSTASSPNIFTSGRMESDHVTITPNNITPASTMPPATPLTTLSLSTPLGDAEHATIKSTTAPNVSGLTTTHLSETSDLNISTAPQPNTGLPDTEHTLASVTSDVSAKTEYFTHLQTLSFTSSQSLHESSTITAPSDITNLTTADVTQLPSTETSVPVVTSEKVHTTEATSGKTHVTSTSSGPLQSLTSSEVTLTSKVSPETSLTEGTTFSAGITRQEFQRALSPGSIAAITITVIAVVLLVFGIAAFMKIRHSSYGRLFDDHDYGSWGNYNNPLYDDS